MGRKKGKDAPGLLIHTWNHGAGSLTICEGLADVRYFLSRLAKMVRLGLIEVVAYTFLPTHFHLLLQSKTGEISRAMCRIQNGFVRWFNRRRKRDGSLFRGRFRSEVIGSDRYRYTLIRYIDQSSVRAGMVTNPAEYPFGSAWHFARENRPRWLSSALIDALSSSRSAGPGAYGEIYGVPLTPGEVFVVERRMASRSDLPDPLDDLVGAAPADRRIWLEGRAALDDGTRPGLVVASPDTLLDALRSIRESEGEFPVRMVRKSVCGWTLIAIALLREICGFGYREIALRLGCSTNKVGEDLDRHRALMASSDEYAERAAKVLSEAMDRDFPEDE